MQCLTIKIRIFPKKSVHLGELSRQYIRVVNQLTEEAERTGNFPKLTTKDVDAPLPSAVLNQAIRDAKSVYRKAKKLGKRPILKKPVYFVNNQNYSIMDQTLSFPIMINGKVKKTKFEALIRDRDQRIAMLGSVPVTSWDHSEDSSYLKSIYLLYGVKFSIYS